MRSHKAQPATPEPMWQAHESPQPSERTKGTICRFGASLEGRMLMSSGELLNGWVSGPLTSTSLLGVPIFWWSRIGKCAQFAAGLTVILDLVGPERLQEWGHKLQVGNSERTRRAQLLLKNWRTMPNAIVAMGEKVYESWRMNRFERDKTKKEKIRRELGAAASEFHKDYPVTAWGGLVGLGIAIVMNAAMLITIWHSITHNYTRSNIGELYWSALRLFAFYLLAKFLPRVAYALTELFLVGVRHVIDRVLVRPVAVTLAARRPGSSIKWISFYVFVAGFMLDLLSS
jgi:hypothetical protein